MEEQNLQLVKHCTLQISSDQLASKLLRQILNYFVSMNLIQATELSIIARATLGLTEGFGSREQACHPRSLCLLGERMTSYSFEVTDPTFQATCN